jgi:hypothetical protein
VPAARSGAFAANFNPDTLNQFRDLCKQHGRQYTKVLERLAEIYLATNGELLNSPSVPRSPSSPNSSNTSIDSASFHDLLKRLEQLEVDYRKADEHLSALLRSLEKRVQNLE